MTALTIRGDRTPAVLRKLAKADARCAPPIGDRQCAFRHEPQAARGRSPRGGVD
jgi:hypothetical protein